MSKHRLFLFVGASLLALAGTASAGGISLTDKQMSVVTAGARNFDFSKQLNSKSDNPMPLSKAAQAPGGSSAQ